MNTSMAPIAPTVTTTPAAGGAQAAPAPAAAAPADFLAMLGQMIGAPVAQASTLPQLPVIAADDASTDAGELPTALPDGQNVTALPLMVPVPLPAPAMPVQGPSAGDSRASMLAEAAPALRSGPIAAAALLVTDMIDGEQQSASNELASFDAIQLPLAPETPQGARTSAGAEAALSRPIHHPVGSQRWADEIGTRVTMMAETGKHTASLRLSPEHLGPLEIRIAIQDDQASVWFGAAHADTRAAIETALPRLRELFDAQGLSLTDAGVFREPPREHAAGQGSRGAGTAEGSAAEEPANITRTIKLGLVDDYA